MATQFIFGPISWIRRLSFGAGLSLLVIFWGCSPNPNSKSKNPKPILVDATYFSAIKACADVYEAKFDLIINLKQGNEKELLKAFIEDSSQLIIGSFAISKDLENIIKQQGFTLNTEPIGFSGLVGISVSKTVFHLSDTLTYFVLKGDQNTARFLTENGCLHVFEISTLDSLFEGLTQNKKAIGVINLYTLNKYKNQFGWVNKELLNILPTLINGDSIFPNTLDLANGKYPYFLPINFLLKKEQIDEEERFIKFLFQRDAQKILQKEGLIPTLNFERNVNIIGSHK